MVRNVWGLLATFPPAGAMCLGERPQAARPTLSATTHTCGHQNREGERKEAWVLMQQKCPVSGERQTCIESTWKQSNVLSLRVTHGQSP